MSRANPRFRRVNQSLPVLGTQGVVMMVIQGTIEGQLTISTFPYLGSVAAPTQAQLQTMITNFHTAMATAYRGAVSNDWSWTRTLAQVISSTTIATAVSGVNAGLAGTNGVGHAPIETADVFVRKTAFKGQHGRGRVSLPPPSLAAVVNSALSNAFVAGPQLAMATAMLASFTDGVNVWLPCVAQRSVSSPKVAIGAAALTFTAGNFFLGTVRRRKVGRGK